MNIDEYKHRLINNVKIKKYLNSTIFDSNKVTIITTSYKSELTIERTIKSVINQSYENIEYIIVDAISTDNTKSIMNKYKDKVSLILSENDNGPSDAANKGISLSTGGYIFLLSSDDWIDNDFIRRAKESLSSSKSDFIFGNLKLVDNITGEISYRYSSLDEVIFKTLTCDFCISMGTEITLSEDNMLL